MEAEHVIFNADQMNCIMSALNKQRNEITEASIMQTACDVIINQKASSHNRPVYVHSCVLAAASPFFASFLQQQHPRSFGHQYPQHIQIDIGVAGVEYEQALRGVIDYMYTGLVRISPGNANAVLDLARIMKLSYLEDSICEILNYTRTSSLINNADTCLESIPVSTGNGVANASDNSADISEDCIEPKTTVTSNGVVSTRGNANTQTTIVVVEFQQPASDQEVRANGLNSMSFRSTNKSLPWLHRRISYNKKMKSAAGSEAIKHVKSSADGRRHLGQSVEVKNEQKDTGRFSCFMCNYTTNNPRTLSAHHRLHLEERCVCYYCDSQMSDCEALQRHEREHEAHESPFSCSVCSQRFKNRIRLICHLTKHSDKKMHECSVCGARFKQKKSLKLHVSIKHKNSNSGSETNNREYLCDMCGYTTAYRGQLKAHTLIHTGGTFTCTHSGCDFLATKPQNLKYHLLTHTHVKSHQCETCGQSFSLVKNLRRHKLLHDKADNNKRCTLCTFTSTRYDKLKEHALKVHDIGSPPERRLRITDLVHLNKSNSNITI